MDELVTKHTAIMDKYDPGKRIWLAVDEWGTWWNVEPGTNPGFLYQQNTLRDAVAAPDGSLWVLTGNTDGRGAPRDGDDVLLRVEVVPAG